MAYCLSRATIPAVKIVTVRGETLSADQYKSHSITTTKSLSVKSGFNHRLDRDIRRIGCNRRRLLTVVNAESRHCEFSNLHIPPESRSETGRLLSNLLQNRRDLFHGAVVEQLQKLGDRRDAAISRMLHSASTSEPVLYRRVAEIEQNECQIALEDIMYMLIFHNFSSIKVHLVPNLSKCIYNNRLELYPSNTSQLESIHSSEVLHIVKEHITNLIGLKSNHSITDEWALTRITSTQLSNFYNSSILHGYFLKSACLRYQMDVKLSPTHFGLKFLHHGLKNLVLEGISNTPQLALNQGSRLRWYMMGFDSDTFERCAKVKSKEARNLVEKHTKALFGNGNNEDEVILTSFGSLKMLVLEAVAFGSFLWDAETCVDTVYKLGD